jgi:hypothetical protein
MPKANLLETLKSDFPQFNWKESARFAFHPPKTINIGPPQPNFPLLALHELAHALLNHKDYAQHISRLKMETAAWNYVKTTLAPRYQIPFDENLAESHLDTYRNWLHQKSRCPVCHLTRYQSTSGAYHCPHCEKNSTPTP